MHLAMLTALTILMGIIPNIGIIQIGVVSLTVLHIPVIIAASLYGIQGGSFVGLIFGLTSWYVASTRAITPMDLLFVNPLVSVFPRIIFGALTGLLFQLFINRDSHWWEETAIAISGSLIHSILVLTALFVFGLNLFYSGSDILAGFGVYLTIIFTANILPEALFAGFVCFSITKALKRN